MNWLGSDTHIPCSNVLPVALKEGRREREREKEKERERERERKEREKGERGSED